MLSILVDSIYYGKFTVVAYNFYNFNVAEGKSALFGSKPFLTYITNFMLDEWNILYPVLIVGIVINGKYHKNKRTFPLFLSLVLAYLLSFSLIKHKEHRFILPISAFC